MAEDVPLVSVLVPCCGLLEYTRLALPRVLRHGRPPLEVWALDAGSLDGTADYLAGVADAAGAPVRVLTAAEPEGLGELAGRAVAAAGGEYVAWVGNDVLVPAGWLHHLLGLAALDARVGAVGPVSNLAPDGQRVAAPYRLGRPAGGGGGLDTAPADAHARAVREAERGRWAPADVLGGFCWLARRAALAAAPPVAPGSAGMDDRAFAAALRRAGWGLAVCRDLYVHHFGANLSGP